MFLEREMAAGGIFSHSNHPHFDPHSACGPDCKWAAWHASAIRLRSDSK